MLAADAKSLIRERYNLFAKKDRMKTGQYKYVDGYGHAGQKLFTPEELKKIPSSAFYYSMGATTPTRLIDIKSGETVLDLGCGVGIDAILAAHKVGSNGKVIGIDLSNELIERAKETVALTGLENIELIAGDMENTPLPSGSVDTVISNGAINLVPDKKAVFKEAYRVLKPGGKLALGDIVLRKKINRELQQRFRENLSGCLGFAVDQTEYLEAIRDAGFVQILVVSRRILCRNELNVMSACPDEKITPPPREEDLEAVSGNVMSIKLTAVKPLN